MLGARNRKWLPKIEALLDEDRDYLVVVGTLHFVGRDGLLALLKATGHKPVRRRNLAGRAWPMRSFAIFLGLIALGLAGIAILGYPAWLLHAALVSTSNSTASRAASACSRCSSASSSSRAGSRWPIARAWDSACRARKFVAEVRQGARCSARC